MIESECDYTVPKFYFLHQNEQKLKSNNSQKNLQRDENGYVSQMGFIFIYIYIFSTWQI